MTAAINGYAHYPVNQPLMPVETGSYDFGMLNLPENSDDIFVELTFSGWGARAAALDYGVLAKMQDTGIGQPGRCLMMSM